MRAGMSPAFSVFPLPGLTGVGRPHTRPALWARRRYACTTLQAQPRPRAAAWVAASAGSQDSRSAAAVDEAAVQRLVQHSRAVSGQHRKLQRLTAEVVAARVRLLLGDGFSEEQVAAVIERSKGGPYFDVIHAAQTLGLLRRLGLTAEQRAGCVVEALSLLSCSPDQVAAVVQLLRAELGANKEQLAQLICRAPGLLASLPETLAAKLAWWRGQVHSEKTLRALLSSLRRFPRVFLYDTESARSKLVLLQAKLGASDEAMARKLPAAVQLMKLDMECTVLPRIDFLLGLLGNTEAVRRRVLNYLTVLALDEDSMLAALAMLEGWMRSREDALGVLRRCLRLFSTGTELGRNFDALEKVMGGAEAAQKALITTPALLALNFGQPAFAARLDFWRGQLGLAAGEVLQHYGTLLKSHLDTVAPRWAWVQRHCPDHGLFPPYILWSDASCMAQYGVPLCRVGGGAGGVPARARGSRQQQRGA